jgi:solute carrier family 25 phosphate transporter 3
MPTPVHTVPSAAFYTYASMSEEAKKELQHASQVTKQKTGKIELHTPKYYTACTIGGILACVHTSLLPPHCKKCHT